MTLAVLKFKGRQINEMHEQIKELTEKQIQLQSSETPLELNDEINRLQATIDKLELDKAHYKNKSREQAVQINVLQRKIQENQQDNDSGDALSDLDKQQELLSNISAKNKHIKRLLRDIEELESQNVIQSRLVAELQEIQRDGNINLATLSQQFHESQVIINKQSDTIKENVLEMENLKQLLAKAAQEKSDINKEVEAFKVQLEERATVWQEILAAKDTELKEIKEKYDELVSKHPGYNIDQERNEFQRLTDAIVDKDRVIQEMEEHIKTLNTTIQDLKNDVSRLTSDKKQFEKEKLESKSGKCCSNTSLLLEKSNERCMELQEALSRIESDNVTKAKQAFDAIEALKNYEKGQYGLPEALVKINHLRDKINSRDKQIRELISDVNQANELAMENCILRKRLNIPIDDVISTKNFVAKQKRYEKLNEKLNLKLRGYEEMVLQLKLERNELRRKLHGDHGDTKKRDSKKKRQENVIDDDEVDISTEDDNSSMLVQSQNLCEKCLKKIKKSKNDQKSPENENYQKLQMLHERVVEENENLRLGMHEILQQLRECDAKTSNVTVDSSTLERLLHALDARSISGWYHPAMRMQNELLATKEREMQLLERVRMNEDLLMKGVVNMGDTQKIIQIDMNQEVTRLREALEEKTQDLEKYKRIVESDDQNQTDLLAETDRLRIVEKQYDDLVAILEKSENERDLLLVSTIKNLNEIEHKMAVMKRKFDYLKQENINLSSAIKKIRIDDLQMIQSLKIELAQKATSDSVSSARQSPVPPTIDQQEIRRVNLELSSSCARLFKNMCRVQGASDTIEMDLTKLENVAIVKDNLAVDLITITEFNDLKSAKERQNQELREMKAKNAQMEKVLEIMNQQLKEQQKMLTKKSDEEINLRHLVADLQSTSDDNYLLVKTKTELDIAQASEEHLKCKNEQLQQEIQELQRELKSNEVDKVQIDRETAEKSKNDSLKIKFLKKTLANLRDAYMLYTPLYAIEDFLRLFAKIIEAKKKLDEREKTLNQQSMQKDLQKLEDDLRKLSNTSEVQLKIDLLKLQTQNQLLNEQLSKLEDKFKEQERTLHETTMKNIENSQHWNTIQMLFTENRTSGGRFATKIIQTDRNSVDKSVGTDKTSHKSSEKQDDPERTPSEKASPMHVGRQIDSEKFAHAVSSQESLKTQLKQALNLASARSALLLETETRLAEAHGRVRSLEKSLEDKESQLKAAKDTKPDKTTNERKEDNILSITIASLQNLLLEKDTTLSRYRELLEAERHEHSKIHEEQLMEIKKLRFKVEEYEKEIKKRDEESKIEVKKAEKDENRKKKKEITSSSDSEDHSSSKIGSVEKQNTESTKEKAQSKALEEEITKLHIQLQEVSDREKIWEKSLNEKESEIRKLREKLQTTHVEGVEITENLVNRRELEQLRALVDEKERHIQDLTETLSHFHDDQQKFMNDTDINATEEVTQLSLELNRAEASNRILKTQLDAIKRQLSNVTQRETQARDLIKNLKAQLIRRPVISIKSESLMSVREEQLRKRNQQLENELSDIKDELHRQRALNDNRRAKSASDLNLWDKQKRWQQTAEKLKEKLNERDAELDKLRATVTTAKNSIARLEREKHILEQRRANHYCNSASCPNLHIATGGNSNDRSASAGGKYSESPESYVTSSVTPEHGGVASVQVLNESNRELVEALKSRVEAQQRRIVALELEGKGSNALVMEIEKLQDANSELQALNVRLEAKNLQFQLENDKLRQGNNSELMLKQIKHLEDYISTIKGELIRSKGAIDAAKETITQERNKNQQLEKTVATLRAMIDKLKTESRPKSGRSSTPTTKSPEKQQPSTSRVSNEMYENLQSEFHKMQKAYNELTEKLTSMQVELQLQTGTCSNCGGRRYSESSSSESVGSGEIPDLETELKRLKEKLTEKTRLLDKAKILLTRAAAKEKNLREQISYLRRRCSELQNVPVIEETSE
ncbi:centrosomal protein Cep290 [Culicoides brevitarsis]|uniref:centrosomal protein Cep290 n=1 Tax=Culicoides brevitarsis TaxID=469753 RepID=UPI00307C0F89